MTPPAGVKKKHRTIEESLSLLVADLSGVRGMNGMFAQSTDSAAVLVVLLESDYANRLALTMEREFFMQNPGTSIDVQIHTIPAEDLEQELKVLASAYDQLWPDNADRR
jgi:hypothetical protein